MTKRAPSVRLEHSYDNESHSAKWRKKKPRGSRSVAPWGNECKCIEIQIIILSRRIAYAPLHIYQDTPGYISVVVLLRAKGLKGGIRGDRYFLSSLY